LVQFATWPLRFPVLASGLFVINSANGPLVPLHRRDRRKGE
jgi:hypothetical protein